MIIIDDNIIEGIRTLAKQLLSDGDHKKYTRDELIEIFGGIVAVTMITAATTAQIESDNKVREALETAAKICDTEAIDLRKFAEPMGARIAEICAETIRALIPNTQLNKKDK